MEESETLNPAEPEPTKRGFRRLLGLVFAVLVLVNVGFAIAVFVLEPKDIHIDITQAERFMKGIEIGNGALADDETTGYALAYDLLLPATQDKLPFPEFHAFFSEQVDEHGFVQSWRRDSREYGTYGNRKLRFEFEYGGMGSESTHITYEVTMSSREDDVGVLEFSLVSTSKKSD